MKILNRDLKKRIITISHKYHLSHLGSVLTAVDIIEDIYSKMDIHRDKFILSSGHAGLAQYVVIEKHQGKNAEDIFKHHGVHPDRCKECFIWASTGSLGHGIGIAVGMALANRNRNIYCLISDGECAEGSVWESLRVANEQKLDNLNVYVNHNNYGAYKYINNDELILKLNTYAPNLMNHVQTNFDDFPFLKGQDAHYKVMNWQEYKLALRILDDDPVREDMDRLEEAVY